eukprot:9195-Rhodomonas_salina.5
MHAGVSITGCRCPHLRCPHLRRQRCCLWLQCGAAFFGSSAAVYGGSAAVAPAALALAWRALWSRRPGPADACAATLLSCVRACVCQCGFSVASVTSAIRLRVCYAMPGTNVAYGAIGLRVCYAIPRTNIAHGATRTELSCTRGKVPFSRYHVSYHATRSLRDPRY